MHLVSFLIPDAIWISFILTMTLKMITRRLSVLEPRLVAAAGACIDPWMPNNEIFVMHWIITYEAYLQLCPSRYLFDYPSTITSPTLNCYRCKGYSASNYCCLFLGHQTNRSLQFGTSTRSSGIKIRLANKSTVRFTLVHICLVKVTFRIQSRHGYLIDR